MLFSMSFWKMSFFVATLLLSLATLSITSIVKGLHVQDYFEQTCSPDRGFVTENFENWSANLTEGTPLYFPLMSALDVLRITQDVFKQSDLSFLSPEEVLQSCLTVQPSLTPVFRLTFEGYCGKSGSKVLTPLAPKVFQASRVYPKGVNGVIRISLSDNKSWQVVDVCWGDGQRSFAVISLYPYLSTCTRKVIIEHLKAIGFNEKYFTGLRYDYDTCKAACRKGFQNGSQISNYDHN